ncbi:Rieske 2Fe-2S domain-containing protein [Spongisporangium articulatum]|uniref:Cytochrome bc1 complex Rieske iron-sulfur subunit n=1 Tax=Spongisporangium articulatum TaxID=3362603 RepID=A0ABW8AT10_9ACTN
MSTHTENEHSAGHGDSHGHVEVHDPDLVNLPEKFTDPGLPPHQHRMGDDDEKAAKRAERQVAALFGLSTVGTLVAIVSYFAVQLKPGPFESFDEFVDFMNRVGLSTKLLGTGLAVALLGIGLGAIHWAKTLMPDTERVEYRHMQRGTDEDRAEAVAILKLGAEESQLGRRPLIRNSLLGAMALLPLPGLILLRDTGPMPGDQLSTTPWKAGTPLTRDVVGGKLLASDLTIGSVVHVMPEGIEELEHKLEERAKAAVLLIRLPESELAAESLPGSYQGIVAYSKICTHMGCPVALYEQQTHHLLCPCHQSTFDLTQGCKVIFGPAKRPLPQLPITVDADGYLIAKAPFDQAVGPSFWERG